jgi:hypothetical protein
MTTKLRQSVKLYPLSLCLDRYSKAAFSSFGLAQWMRAIFSL